MLYPPAATSLLFQLLLYVPDIAGVHLSQSENIDQAGFSAEFMELFVGVVIVDKLDLHSETAVVVSMVDRQRIRRFLIDDEFLMFVEEVKFQFSLIGDKPIGVNLHEAGIVGLFYGADIDGLVSLDQHGLSGYSDISTQKIVLMMNGVF